MDEDPILAAIQGIFRELFGEPGLLVGPETTAAMVPGWDSFRHIELVLAVQEHFGVALRTREVDGLRNVGEMVALVRGKGKLTQAAPPE